MAKKVYIEVREANEVKNENGGGTYIDGDVIGYQFFHVIEYCPEDIDYRMDAISNFIKEMLSDGKEEK